MHQKTALESAVETVSRQVKDRTRKEQKQALETHDESLYRQARFISEGGEGVLSPPSWD